MYSNFILNLYIAYQLNAWQRNLINVFTLKNCLFGKLQLTRNAGKSRYINNGGGKAFDIKGYWSFINDIAKNDVIFGVDNSSSSRIDNPKNNFLVLVEGPTEATNGSVSAEKK